MAKYTEEQLNACSKEMLITLLLSMQDQMVQLNQNFEKLMEQLAAANNQRYGRSSEKLSVIDGQLSMDDLIFNEAEDRKSRPPEEFVTKQYCNTVTWCKYHECQVYKRASAIPHKPGIPEERHPYFPSGHGELDDPAG